MYLKWFPRTLCSQTSYAFPLNHPQSTDVDERWRTCALLTKATTWNTPLHSTSSHLANKWWRCPPPFIAGLWGVEIYNPEPYYRPEVSEMTPPINCNSAAPSWHVTHFPKKSPLSSIVEPGAGSGAARFVETLYIYEPCLSNYYTGQCALWGKGRCFINAKQLNGLRVMNPLLAIIITKHESTPPPTTKELFSLPVWLNIKRAARHCWTGLSPCTHSRRPNNLFHRLNSIYRNPLRHRNRDGLPN